MSNPSVAHVPADLQLPTRARTCAPAPAPAPAQSFGGGGFDPVHPDRRSTRTRARTRATTGDAQ
jgi:hypothetical protein